MQIDETQYQIVLGDYSDPNRMFFHQRILLRALIEAKFNEVSYDKEILGSEVVALLSNQISFQLDNLEASLFGNTSRPNARWLTIKTDSHRVFKVVESKVKNDSNKVEHIKSLEGGRKIEYISVLFAPYHLPKSLIRQFLTQLGV